MNVTKNKIIKKIYTISIWGQYQVEDTIEAKSSKEAQALAEKKYFDGFYENSKSKKITKPRIYERHILKTIEYTGENNG